MQKIFTFFNKKNMSILDCLHTGRLNECLTNIKCLSIGTPNIINFPFVSNGKLMDLGVPIFKHIVMRLYSAYILGLLNIMNFPFGTNGKFIISRCPNT